jgi:cephalosporin-C deacetylase-like acetyl esterase
MDTDSDCPLNTAYSMGANMKARINGMNVVYTDEGKGPALVFLHGFPLNRATWQKQLDAFRASYRIIEVLVRAKREVVRRQWLSLQKTRTNCSNRSEYRRSF